MVLTGGTCDDEVLSPLRRPPAREATALLESGELGEAELAELMPEWLERYGQAQDPKFACCLRQAKPGDTFATWPRAWRRGGRSIAERVFRTQLSSNGTPSAGAEPRRSVSWRKRRLNLKRPRRRSVVRYFRRGPVPQD